MIKNCVNIYKNKEKKENRQQIRRFHYEISYKRSLNHPRPAAIPVPICMLLPLPSSLLLHTTCLQAVSKSLCRNAGYLFHPAQHEPEI